MTKLTDDQVKDVLVSAYRESLTCGKCFTVNVVLDGADGELKTYTWQGSNISEAVFNGQDKIVKYFSGGDNEDLISAYLEDTTDLTIAKDCIAHASYLDEEIEGKVIEACAGKDLDELEAYEINEILDDAGVFDAYEPDAIDWAVDAYCETVWDDVEMVMKEIDGEE